MELTQKKFSNKILFEFGAEQLKFTLKEKGSRNTFKVNYGAVPIDFNELQERNEWFRNVGIIWVIIGVLQISIMFSKTGTIGSMFWFLIGSACLLYYFFAKIQYTVYPTEMGNIFIIQDKQHDVIISEIKKRKRKQLLEWYGKVNYENEPSNEMEKYKWLLSEEVITDDEYKNYLNEIGKAHPEIVPQEIGNPQLIH